jgi:hypothetical protein
MAFRRHGVRRLASGGLRITTSTTEHATLRALPRQLEPIVTGEADGAAADALRARLYPAAYEDPRLEEEYRGLVGEELVEGRVDALRTFARTLEGGRTSGGTWSVDVEPEEAQAWLGVVNDARLLLAGAIGITSEEQWEAGPDASDPASVLLWYLGWLEEQLVGALMGGLPDA